MSALLARGLTVSRGSQVVLDGVDLSLMPGVRTGIVGPNGAGKSTLLGSLAGAVPIDAGTVSSTPPGATIGYLPQEPHRSSTETVAGFLARRTGVADAEAALTATAASLAAGGSDGADDAYSSALERWLSLGAADFDARVAEVWASLGLDRRLLDLPTASLSGGEAARAGIAALILSRFDVYLLDEPTNDLDHDGLERLEAWMSGLRSPTALVSHDRTLLARTINEVVELDEFTHRATTYRGGWDAYLHERETARRRATEEYEAYEARRRDLLARAQREREWSSRGVGRVRRSGEPDKNIRSFKLDQAERLVGRAARTARSVERLDAVERPHLPWKLHVSIGSPGRSGDLVAALTGAVVDHGSFRLGPIDLAITSGERVAIVGANGSGKTTLIEALLGDRALERGDRRLGSSVVVGHVEQARGDMTSASAVLDVFVGATGWSATESRTLLAKFGLGAVHVGRPASTLSPGERTRAALAVLMANGANLLVLDEPTNHLDLAAIEQLESALDAFVGTVLLVSHDRAFVDHVRLTRRIVLSGGRIVADDPA